MMGERPIDRAALFYEFLLDMLRHVFEAVVRRCMAEGLVGGEGFAVDAGLIDADINRQSGVQSVEALAPFRSRRAVREYLAVLDDPAFGVATSVAPKYLAPIQCDPPGRSHCCQDHDHASS